jgi:hypothetical protein
VTMTKLQLAGGFSIVVGLGGLRDRGLRRLPATVRVSGRRS